MSGRRSSSGDESDPPTPKNKKVCEIKKTKHRAQHYRKEWESNPELAKWIQADKTTSLKAKWESSCDRAPR